MAEQVNQRLEELINELEQMKRTGLYDDNELNDISRQRKRLEYQLQRHEKKMEDFVSYITYELALLEDISDKRKKAKMTEKRKDIEYAIAGRVNRIFKQFIHRFQEVKVYFEYFKFCKSVGFETSASGMIGEMLQMHGDKPVSWQFASLWEIEEQNNIDGARNFLLKGLQRHPDAESLYVELFKIELIQATFKTEEEDEKEKIMKRADIVWQNGVKNVQNNVTFLFQCLELALKYDIPNNMLESIKDAIWDCKGEKGTLPYIAEKELEGCHWSNIEDYAGSEFPAPVNYCIAAFEEALASFPEEQLCTKYIHLLLGMNENVCDDLQKIEVVKHAWWVGYKSDLLTDDMFQFGLDILKLEGETSDEEMLKILNEATEKHTKHKSLWIEKLALTQNDEMKQIALLQKAAKVLKTEDAIFLYNQLIDGVQNPETLNKLLKKFQNCESIVLLAVKPKLLQKMYDINGINSARTFYNDLLKIPPTQLGIHQVMISLEMEQCKPNKKEIRRCYECAVMNHGTNNVELWNDYIDFEVKVGDHMKGPSIYRRAQSTLLPELLNNFIAKQSLQRIS